MFKPVSSKLNVNEMEEGVLKFWKDENIFKKSTDNRDKNEKRVPAKVRLPQTENPVYIM